tara:strand:- start:295 stop:432 length:138 start_codon:yes stop_codon:yes gene_type:complete
MKDNKDIVEEPTPAKSDAKAIRIAKSDKSRKRRVSKEELYEKRWK